MMQYDATAIKIRKISSRRFNSSELHLIDPNQPHSQGSLYPRWMVGILLCNLFDAELWSYVIEFWSYDVVIFLSIKMQTL